MSRGRGRPPVGPRVPLRLEEDLLDEVDRLADDEAVSRAELLRQLIRLGLANYPG